MWKYVLLSSCSQYTGIQQLYVDSLYIVSYVWWEARWSQGQCARSGSSPGRDIMLCSWARHLTLAVPLSTLVYKCNWRI